MVWNPRFLAGSCMRTAFYTVSSKTSKILKRTKEKQAKKFLNMSYNGERLKRKRKKQLAGDE